MLKKIIIVSLLAAAVSGCASRTGTAALVGGTVGYIIGQSENERKHQQAPVVVREVPHKTYTETQVIRPTGVYPDYSVCSQWHYQARESCYRGAEARARQEQNRINQEAYRRGYQGR